MLVVLSEPRDRPRRWTCWTFLGFSTVWQCVSSVFLYLCDFIFVDLQNKKKQNIFVHFGCPYVDIRLAFTSFPQIRFFSRCGLSFLFLNSGMAQNIHDRIPRARHICDPRTHVTIPPLSVCFDFLLTSGTWQMWKSIWRYYTNWDFIHFQGRVWGIV